MTYSFPRQLIVAAVFAAMGAVAVAQTPPPAGNPPARQERQERMGRMEPAQMQQRMQEHRAKRMAHFRETLQITPAQEGAWSAWTASKQRPADWKRPDRAEFERLTTPERIDRMRALRAERATRMDKRAEATKVFYAALNPTQKRVFDVETAHRGRGHGGGGGGGDREGGRGGHHRHHMG